MLDEEKVKELEIAWNNFKIALKEEQPFKFIYDSMIKFLDWAYDKLNKEEKYQPYNEDIDCIKDEIGGVHDEGLGWNPNGVFCGECSNMNCKDCPSRNATK